MREILFKAKRLDNGEWVEGFCVNISNKHLYIFTGKLDISNGYLDLEKYSVGPKTLCQYTGLTDKNGNKIWENDAVRYEDDLVNMVKVDLIGWNETHAAFTILADEKGNMKYYYIDEFIASNFEVIGNIFDNPELMKNE